MLNTNFVAAMSLFVGFFKQCYLSPTFWKGSKGEKGPEEKSLVCSVSCVQQSLLDIHWVVLKLQALSHDRHLSLQLPCKSPRCGV